MDLIICFECFSGLGGFVQNTQIDFRASNHSSCAWVRRFTVVKQNNVISYRLSCRFRTQEPKCNFWWHCTFSPSHCDWQLSAPPSLTCTCCTCVSATAERSNVFLCNKVLREKQKKINILTIKFYFWTESESGLNVFVYNFSDNLKS